MRNSGPLSRVLAVLIGGLLAPALAGQEPAPKRTIVATGTATVKVAPDAARVAFGIGTTGGTVKGTREENGKQVKRLIEGLQELKVKDLEVHVADSNMSTAYAAGRNPEGTAKVIGLQIRSTVTVLVRSKENAKLRELVNKLIDIGVDFGATAPGANVDDGISSGFKASSRTAAGPRVDWLKEDSSDARHLALTAALKDAVANAQALAGSSKITLLETVLVSSGPSDDAVAVSPITGLPPPRAALRAEASDSHESTTITVRVKVTCVY